MIIVFDPPFSKANKYCEIFTSSFRKHGVEVFAVKDIFSSYSKFSKVKIIHLNWYENLDNIIDFIKKAIKLWLLIICGKKIVWTMHNKFPHSNQVLFYKNVLFKWLIKYSDRIIIHSKISEQILLDFNPLIKTKIVYIPHPNYIDVYKGIATPKVSDMRTKKLSLLFLGAIKPYKNIELLIEALKTFNTESVELIIAGKPLNDSYAAAISALAKASPNISINLNFLDDADMIRYICLCDLMVLPYDVVSSLNSGTLMLAFSLKKTAICPQIGTTQDFKDTNDIISYNYTDHGDHFDKLKEKITHSILLKQNDSDIFNSMGTRLYEEVVVKNDPENITNQYLELYSLIISS